MIAVWYDADCDAIWVAFAPDPFLPRSLQAACDGDTIAITRCVGGQPVLAAPYGQIVRRDGSGFTDPDACIAYLAHEFARAPARVPVVAATAAEAIPAGLPIALSQANGAAQVARADTYALAFVAGLAAADAGPGFPLEAVRSSLTLSDWTTCAGGPDLVVGRPYFLAPAGGITLAPDRTPGMSLVRVGTAADPRTLVFTSSDPILL